MSVENVDINFRVNNNIINQSVVILQQINNQINKISNNNANILNKFETMGQSIKNVGNAIKNVGQSLTENISKPIIGGLAASVKASMDLEKQLDFTGAKAGATGKEMEQLKDQTIKLGIATKYSALEVAKGQEEMIKAGRTITQVFDEMDDVLNLAAAGNIEVAQAAEISSNVLNMFSKQGVTATKVANLMAGAANASAIDVQEFYTSLSYVGPAAASLGISLEDVSGVIGVLGNNAIKGSKAGTGLRQFLMRLQPASDKAAAAMQELGLITKNGANQFYDAQGKMKSLSDIVGTLKNSLNGLTDAQKQDKLKTIFGLIASPTVNTLVNQNTSAIEDMKEAIGKITAEEVAARQMDNLSGSIEYFQSTVEAISVKIGDLFIPILNTLLKSVTKVLNIFAGLPSPLLAVGVAFALIVAAIGPVIMIVGTLIAALGGVIAVMAGVGAAITIIGWPVLLGFIAGATLAFAGIVSVVYEFIKSYFNLVTSTIPVIDTLKLLKDVLSGDLKNATKTLTDKFGMSSEAAKKLTKSLGDIGEKAKALWEIFSKNLGTVFKVITDDIFGSVGAFDKLNNSTDKTKTNVTGTFQKIIKPIEDFINRIYKLADSMGLISVEAKVSGDKTAATYIQLSANVDKSLNQMANMQKNFGGILNKENNEAYSKLLGDTKKYMDDEYKFMAQQIDKKKAAAIKGATELYKNSSALSEKEEQAAIAKTNEYYEKKKIDLQANNARILEIEKIALKENRELTESELRRIDELKKLNDDKNIQLLTSSKLKQKVILEEIRNQSTTITRQEAMEVVVEANNKYTKVVDAARKTKEDSIASAIEQRDGSKSISKEQADALIREANNTYTSTVGAAATTKSETIRLANEKSGGILSEEDLLKTSLDGKQKDIKKLIEKTWQDLKETVKPIIEELCDIIVKSIEDSLVEGIKKTMANAAKAFIDGLSNFGGSAEISVAGRISEKSKGTSSSKKNTSSNYTNLHTYGGHALGTRYSSGGMKLVGEAGVELVSLPRGSQVYNNSQTRSILNNSNSRNVTINYSGGTTTEDKNRFTNILRTAGVY